MGTAGAVSDDEGRIRNEMKQAPTLQHNGVKSRVEKEQYYQIPQALADAVFSVLGNSSAQLRIMLVLIGTKPGFNISQKWILQRTGLKERSYIEARKALVARGWIKHLECDSIIVNLDKIYADGEEKKNAEQPATIAGKNMPASTSGNEKLPAIITGEQHNAISGDTPAFITDIINKEQSKIEQNNIMEKPQLQEKLGPAQKNPIITTRSNALFLEHSGNKLDWISDNEFYINGRYCIVKDIVIQTA